VKRRNRCVAGRNGLELRTGRKDLKEEMEGRSKKGTMKGKDGWKE
jgi:hypothetical protein